jgi:hypothetical protein
MIRNPRTVAVPIANGETTSAVVCLRDHAMVGLITPAALTSTAITFTASTTEGGTFVPVYDSDGSVVSLAVAQARAIGLSGAEADALAPFVWIKVVCGSAEADDRVLTLVLK